jgi:zinc protease
VLGASGLSDNFDAWFGLALEILFNPSFPVDELEKLKQRQRAQLRQQRAGANFLVNERFSRAVYGEHPAATVSATPESIDAITREALVGWHRERYRPQNAILGIAGDVSASRLVSKLDRSARQYCHRPAQPGLSGDGRDESCDRRRRYGTPVS